MKRLFYNIQAINMKKLIFILLLLPCICFAQHPTTWDLSRISFVPLAPTPTITVQYTSLTPFTNIAGTPSSDQTDNVTFTALAASTGAISAVTGFEQSIDGGSSWHASFTGIANGNYTLHVRVAGATAAGTPSGTINVTGTGATSQTIAISATVSAPSFAIFNLSSTSSTQTGAKNFFGNPTSTLTATESTTGWQLANIPGNWTSFGGNGGTGNGATSPSSGGTFTQPQINSAMFTYNQSFASGVYQFQFPNLPAGTYALTFLGSVPTATFPNTGNERIYVRFSSSGVQTNYAEFNPNDNLTEVGPGAVTSGTFTGTITAGQFIYIALVRSTGQAGFLNAIKITKTN